MAAQAQDARAEADRLESVSAEQRQETGAARTDVEESLRKADQIDPDVRTRSDKDLGARRAADEPLADEDVRDRGVRDDVRDGAVDDDVRDRTVRDDVRDRTVRDEQASSPRRDVDDSATRDDFRRGDDRGNRVVEDDRGDRGVVDERSTDPAPLTA